MTVTAKLFETGHIDRVGGPGFLASLSDNVGSARNIEFWGGLIKKQSILRQTYDMCHKTLADIKPNSNVDSLLGGLASECVEILSKNNYSKENPITAVVAEIRERLEKIASGGMALGVPTGFTDLDRLTGGFQPSDLIILAARPSMGKSAMALNIAQYAAKVMNIPTGFFSLEMCKEQLGGRLISGLSGIPAKRVVRYDIYGHEWGAFSDAEAEIANVPLYIDDTGGLSVEEIQSRAMRWKKTYGLGLLLIDYIQYVGTNKGKGSREQDISHISRSLKGLAKELKIPVVALSQLNRSLEYRDDKRPKLSDLRESGSIEQDADVVLMIYRQEVYTQDPEDGGKAEVLIRKQRNGPLGTVHLQFDASSIQFQKLRAWHGSRV